MGLMTNVLITIIVFPRSQALHLYEPCCAESILIRPLLRTSDKNNQKHYAKDIKLRNYHQIINIAKLSKSAPAVQKCNNIRNLTSSETTVINKRCKDLCVKICEREKSKNKNYNNKRVGLKT